MKGVAILGSTGSIGTSALDLIERLEKTEPGMFKVVGLAANRRVDLLSDQILRFEPRLAAIGSEDLAEAVRRRIGDSPTRLVVGGEGLVSIATMEEADVVLAGIVGAAGLGSTHAAVSRGKTVALANKEALVMAGEPVTEAARRSGAIILPVDSEHNALHQCLRGEKLEEVRRLVLTASGGPFFPRPEIDLERVTVEEALAHPTWDMGRKISIDSATLMNKGLEIIEARWLFGLPGDKISVVIHPQSAIHSMVEFVDGSIICQLGATDMRHPIQYALTHPDRRPTPLPAVDLSSLSGLEFHEPDNRRFPCLRLGRAALDAGGTMPAVLNAANEVAVESFLERTIRFTDIPRIIESVMSGHDPVPAGSLEEVLEADRWAREAALEAVQVRSSSTADRTGGIA